MRVVTQENVIQRNRSVAQISFFFSIAALVASFFFGNTLAGANDQAAFYVQCLMMPTLFVIILFSVRQANSWIREPVPWTAVQEALRGTNADATLYQFVMMPARHILVSPQGVYLIYPMFQDRPIIIDGKRWQIPGGFFARLMVFMRQEGLGDPAGLAELEAKYATRIINKHLDTAIEVTPIVFFTHPNAKIMVEDEPEIAVTSGASGLDVPTLKEYLKSQKNEGRPTLSQEQIDALDDILLYE